MNGLNVRLPLRPIESPRISLSTAEVAIEAGEAAQHEDVQERLLLQLRTRMHKGGEETEKAGAQNGIRANNSWKQRWDSTKSTTPTPCPSATKVKGTCPKSHGTTPTERAQTRSDCRTHTHGLQCHSFDELMRSDLVIALADRGGETKHYLVLLAMPTCTLLRLNSWRPLTLLHQFQALVSLPSTQLPAS